MTTLSDRLRNRWIARELRDLRLKRGFTQAKLAQLAGIKTHATVSGYECGDNVPTIERLIELLDALCFSPSEFFGNMPTTIEFEEMVAEGVGIELHKYSMVRTGEQTDTSTPNEPRPLPNQ